MTRKLDAQMRSEAFPVAVVFSAFLALIVCGSAIVILIGVLS